MAPLDDIRLTFVRDLDDVGRMMQWLGERRGMLAVDTETTGLNVGADHIRLCQFGDHREGWALDFQEWKGVCRQVIENYTGPMVCHNLLYDSKMLKSEGIVIPQKLAHDTMVMTWLMNPAARFDLKGAATKYVDKRAKVGQSALKQAMAANGWTWSTVPIDFPAYWQYGALDTCLTGMLADVLYPETGGGVYRRAYETELGCIHSLREAELAGMAIDEDYRRRCRDQLLYDLEALHNQLPVGMKVSSDRQVIDFLHELGARWNILTEKGNLSVDKDALKFIARGGYPIASVIADARSKTNMLNNYIEKLAPIGSNDRGLAVGGAVYANTKPLVARTGRMSVTDPPLQTLPRGRLVRDAFVAREGHVFVQADFAGMEMRCLASYAQETEMLAAFDRGEDLHNFVARALYGEGFTKPQRSICKNAGFAKVYGAGVEQFAATAEIDVDTARQFLASYDAMFPGVATFMAKVSNAVVYRAGGKKRGYGHVMLVDGRKLPVEADESYKGTNYVIQGSCAVSVKERINALDQAGLGSMFRLAVHDELLFEAPVEHAAEVREIVRRIMPDSFNFPGVTLTVDTDVISRWGHHYRDDYDAYLPTESVAFDADGTRHDEGVRPT